MAATVRNEQASGFDGVHSWTGPGSVTGGLWGDCSVVASHLTDPTSYVAVLDDFYTWNDSDGYVATQATAGTVAAVAAVGGAIDLDSNSTTPGQGIQVQSLLRFPAPSAGKKIWFETRLKVTDAIGGAQIFAGLSVADTTIFASGAVSASDFVGFVQDAADIAAASGKVRLQSSSGTVAEGSTIDLVEDTFIDLGFRVNGVSSVDVYVNGALTQTVDISGTNVAPETDLAISFVCQSDGTVDPIMRVDWVRAVAQR